MSKLTPKELLQVELAQCQLQLSERAVDKEIYEKGRIEGQLKELSLRVLLLKKEEQEKLQAIYRARELHEEQKKSKASLMKELASKKNIKGSWGYDPDTGDIII